VIKARRLRWERGEMVGKPEGKRPLRRLMHRWEDNNKMGVKELG